VSPPSTIVMVLLARITVKGAPPSTIVMVLLARVTVKGTTINYCYGPPGPSHCCYGPPGPSHC